MANKKDMSKYEITMRSRGVPKDEKKFFSYGALEKKLWGEKISEAHKAFNIRFDHENDDGSTKRIITIEIPDEYNKKTGRDSYVFRCQICFAGGDWEESNCYFKCQISEGSLYDMTRYPGNINSHTDNSFIVIPGPSDGNTHLEKGKESGYVSMNAQSSKKDTPELDEKQAWKFLEGYLSDLILEYLKKGELKEMLEKNEDPGEEMAKKVAMLDKIADDLEAKGLLTEAAEIDLLSNTLEKLAVYDVMQGNPAKKQMAYQDRMLLQREAPGLWVAAEGIKGHQDHLVRQNLDKQYGPQIGAKLYDLAEAYAWNRAPAMNLASQWSNLKKNVMTQPIVQPEDPFLPRRQTQVPQTVDTGQGFFLEKMSFDQKTAVLRRLESLEVSLKKRGMDKHASVLSGIIKKAKKN